MRNLYIFGLIGIVALIITAAYAEELTLTTYYPAPYGVYKEMRLSPNILPSVCDADSEGTMYYDDNTNQLMVCRETIPLAYAWENFTSYWAASPVDSNNIYNINTGKVGIGTNDPEEQLHITENFRLPPTDGTVGMIKVGEDSFIHNYGNANTYVGINSGKLIWPTGAVGNTAVGENTLSKIDLASENSAFGSNALKENTKGDMNSGIGSHALYENTTGDWNIGVGGMALRFNTTGNYNAAVGNYALSGNNTGSNNTAVGCGAGKGVRNNSFSNNTLIGYNVGYALTTGSNNILMGYQAGDSLTTGSQNIIIGYDQDAPAVDTNDFLNIGGIIYGNLSNGNVGIGTASPTAGSRLHVKDGHIRVENGSFIDDGTTLNVPDYVFEPEYKLKRLLEVEKFVLEHKHLEGLPALGDSKSWAALSMQDRDMKLLEKIEELTLYVIEQDKRIKELESAL